MSPIFPLVVSMSFTQLIGFSRHLLPTIIFNFSPSLFPLVFFKKYFPSGIPSLVEYKFKEVFPSLLFSCINTGILSTILSVLWINLQGMREVV